MLKTRGVGSTNPRGKIINVASLLSYQGGLTVPAYAAAKHGVLGLASAFSRMRRNIAEHGRPDQGSVERMEPQGYQR
jgi:NAD(P)-dependent dehydrogenase (short-subunit alcohol dehydrogenase family)